MIFLNKISLPSFSIPSLYCSSYHFLSFSHTDIEPGHIPGTINMPFAKFMDASGKELELEELAKMFREAGVDMEKPFWVTCGSGVTACHVVLAAHLLGHSGSVSVYDGSWYEWFKRAAPEHVISEGKGKQV